MYNMCILENHLDISSIYFSRKSFITPAHNTHTYNVTIYVYGFMHKHHAYLLANHSGHYPPPHDREAQFRSLSHTINSAIIKRGGSSSDSVRWKYFMSEVILRLHSHLINETDGIS